MMGIKTPVRGQKAAPLRTQRRRPKKAARSERGSFVVEASVAFVAFAFFYMFTLSYVQVSSAQNLVAHAILQTGQKLSAKSYADDKLDAIGWSLGGLFDAIGLGDEFDINQWYENEDTVVEAVKESVLQYVGHGDEAKADLLLKELNVRNGVSGLDFTGTKIEGKDLHIQVSYGADLWFSEFFGVDIESFRITQTVKARMWK
jgi:hypothetical protein